MINFKGWNPRFRFPIRCWETDLSGAYGYAIDLGALC